MRAFLGALVIVLVALAAAPRPAAAQDQVYVQIEARPSLPAARARAAAWASELPDVTGFRMNTGWYAIALGPYDRGTADAVLQSFRASARIPSDSYIAFPSAYAERFWPDGPGVALPLPGPDDAPRVALPEGVPDETPQEARASERLLTRAEREELQVALQWAGVYFGAIDGAFGRGTRSAMAAWQEAQGFVPTGVLTTAQRAALIDAYNAILDGMDLQYVADAQAGIAIDMPLGVVALNRYEPPIAHYTATGEVPAQVLLISQPGNAATLAGLYEVLQTLEIMPLEGPRRLGPRSFEITGSDAARHSYARAQLFDGAVKGFVLVWPAGDEERRARILSSMQASFTPLPGTLGPADAAPDAVQSLDLVAGLAVRKPRLSRSGFFVDPQGAVLTGAEAVEGCARVTLDRDIRAEVVARDPQLGLALLRAEEPLSPIGIASFATRPARLQSEIAVAGYSFEGALGAPTLTFGRIADLAGLGGEEQLARLSVETMPGDAGGPVLASGGQVLGLLRGAGGEEARRLPGDVRFATEAGAIVAWLAEAGISPAAGDPGPAIPPEDLSRLAADMTVLVSCWD